ncbi:MAG: hypothetical protein WCQ47_05355 [bacterium]
MKKLFVVLGSLVIMSLFISDLEASPQTACGYVVGLAFRTAVATPTQQFTATTAIAISGGMPGLPTGMAQTLDRDFAKIALLAKLNGIQLCLMYDIDAPADNNVIQLQP